jgi:hypothetical protein
MTNPTTETEWKRIIYLSGPMKGYPERNYPLFQEVTAKLRANGHRVYDPSEFPHPDPTQPFPIRAAFAAYSSFICLEADMLILLPGWEKSKGASAERALADNCGIEIIEWSIANHPITLRRNPHADDTAVDSFAHEMKEKLSRKRDEGRGGWENKAECSAEFLSQLLRSHVEKGDPVDVANFCMMLFNRGERIA